MSQRYEPQPQTPYAPYQLNCAPALNWSDLAAAPSPIANNLREPSLAARIIETRSAVEAHGDDRALPHLDSALEGVWQFVQQGHNVMPLLTVSCDGWDQPAMSTLRGRIEQMFGITPDNIHAQTIRDDTHYDAYGVVLLKGQIDAQTPVYLQYAQSRTVYGSRTITVIDGRPIPENQQQLWAAATACSWHELVTATYALRENSGLRATEEEIATLLSSGLINRSSTPNNIGLAHVLAELRELRKKTQVLPVRQGPAIQVPVIAGHGDVAAG